MKKAIGRTVRDLKRGVNKKVLKVPSIEQKVLDATSNEPWGPHGSLLADIAQATRNYHEYQMIMAVIWKRISDTGKNWRHVYKALTVLEYLVAYGSERVIDEIREHAYQISTLSDFQYIDSGGRDQGNNVRRKSQILVLLVNDNERIAEARQKAAANKDKFHNNAAGGIYRPGSGVYDRYEDDRYGSRDDDRNGYGYGRERESSSRDEDQYSCDGDRYGRDNEGCYSGDGYRGDDYQYGSRSRSSDRHRDHNYDDDGQHSSRGSNAKAEDPSLEGRLERKFSEQYIGASPSYEEAVVKSQSSVHSERDGENSTVSAPGGSPPPINNKPSQTSAPRGSSPPPVSDNLTQATAAASISTSADQKVEAFDEFDPRGAVSAAPATTNNVEMDLLGSLSESFSPNALALVPATSTSEANAFANANSGSAAVFSVAPSVSNNNNQAFEDPFGESPFKAITSTESTSSQSQVYQGVVPTQSSSLSAESVSNLKFEDSFSAVTDSSSGATNTQAFPTNSQYSSQCFSTPLQETDILADILPPALFPAVTSQQDISAAAAQIAPPSYSASINQTTSQSFSVPTSQYVQQSSSTPTGKPAQPFSATASQYAPFSGPTVQPPQPPFLSPAGQPVQQPFSAHIGQPTLGSVDVHGGFPSHTGSLIPGAPNITPQSQTGYNSQISGGTTLHQGTAAPIPSNMATQTPTGHVAQSANYFPQQGVSTAHTTSLTATQSSNGHASQYNSGGFNEQQSGATPFSSPMTYQTPGAPGGNQSDDALGSLFGQAGTNAPRASQYSASLSTGSNAVVPHQPSKDKFETKSTVWADTLSRGLVNLNISGPKTNPLADIGIDFDAINRKEKRMEKPTTTAVTSTVTMGKAMGSGSGMGRAGASSLRSPSPVMGSGMGNGPGVNMGMGLGGYGGMNPSMGMAGMGTNMRGMGQGFQMQQPTGFPPGYNPPGNYNSMMGPGSYAHQPYGGGY